MAATKQKWTYPQGERVWVGKYKNSQNTLHWHNDCELIYVDVGELDVVCGGTRYRLETGDSMFIGGDVLHMINALNPDTVLTTFIFENEIISDFAENIELCSPVISGDYHLPEIYGKVFCETKQKKALYVHAVTAEIYGLMLDIYRNEHTEPKKPAPKADVKLKALFEQIHAHYDIYTLDDAAKFMGMNASYLSRFFTARTGMHFMRYVNCVKVEHAVEMLKADNDNVTEIADKCGFGTIRNFNRIFKLLTGYSPSGLPDDYYFIYAAPHTDGPSHKYADPTLFGCELLESSDSKEKY